MWRPVNRIKVGQPDVAVSWLICVAKVLPVFVVFFFSSSSCTLVQWPTTTTVSRPLVDYNFGNGRPRREEFFAMHMAHGGQPHTAPYPRIYRKWMSG